MLLCRAFQSLVLVTCLCLSLPSQHSPARASRGTGCGISVCGDQSPRLGHCSEPALPADTTQRRHIFLGKCWLCPCPTTVKASLPNPAVKRRAPTWPAQPWSRSAGGLCTLTSALGQPCNGTAPCVLLCPTVRPCPAIPGVKPLAPQHPYTAWCSQETAARGGAGHW